MIDFEKIEFGKVKDNDKEWLSIWLSLTNPLNGKPALFGKMCQTQKEINSTLVAERRLLNEDGVEDYLKTKEGWV